MCAIFLRSIFDCLCERVSFTPVASKAKDLKPTPPKQAQKKIVGYKTVCHIVKAEGLRKGDMFGGADPYCIMRIGKEEKRTRIITGTRKPEWNEVVCIQLRPYFVRLSYY